MIHEIRPCTVDEITELGNYLANNSWVKQIGRAILEGRAGVKIGKVGTLNELGNLKTMTGFIDDSAITGSNRPLQPTSEFKGEKKYLVKEVLPSLQGKDINDGSHIQTIEKYISMFAKGDKIQMILSALEYKGDFMLVDGNKRSVAYYETTNFKGIKDIDLKIHVIPIGDQLH
jgi:hypothetical protein